MTIFRFFYWVIKDAITKIKNKKKGIEKAHLYGIYGYFGLPGKGKTMGLVYTLEQYKKKYGDKIYICTNFGYKNQDFAFTHWKQLLEVYDKPLVVAWDEVQNEFNSRDFTKFPVTLLTLLTQNRKGNGIQILYTAQRYNRVDKVFRELTHQSIMCNTLAGRLTRLNYYYWEDYEQLNNTVEVNRKIKIKKVRTVTFVQTDELRQLYDSYQMLESAKKKTYRDFEPQTD